MIIRNIEGVSIILCCYNSINRIRETLQALSEQVVGKNLQWEVILVDNASTDTTGEVANAIWHSLGNKTQMRIVSEPKPGLGEARNRGIAEAAFGTLVFCDDDNWLGPNYIETAKAIMNADKQIAACGGLGIPVFEIQPAPIWFDEYAEAFALGPQTLNTENGKILNLYGAGLVVRKEYLMELYNSGFHPTMSGRTGKKLSSSEDTELTYALF